MDIKEYIQSGIVESYVLGLATDEEILEVESLSVQHPDLAKAISDFSETLEKQALANAIVPPAAIKERIIDTLKSEFVAAPVTNKLAAVPATIKPEEKLVPPTKLKVWRFAAAASLILLLVSAALNLYLFNRYSVTSNQYQALLTERNSLQARNDVFQTRLNQWQSASQMMADPAMAMIKMPAAPGKQNMMATLFWDTRSKDVYVMANKLPSPTSGKQYQLWAMVNGKPVNAGMIESDCTSLCKMKNIPTAEAFAITLENQGGVPSPTMEQMVVYAGI